jgi:hypothetical protein
MRYVIREKFFRLTEDSVIYGEDGQPIYEVSQLKLKGIDQRKHERPHFKPFSLVSQVSQSSSRT